MVSWLNACEVAGKQRSPCSAAEQPGSQVSGLGSLPMPPRIPPPRRPGWFPSAPLPVGELGFPVKRYTSHQTLLRSARTPSPLRRPRGEGTSPCPPHSAASLHPAVGPAHIPTHCLSSCHPPAPSQASSSGDTLSPPSHLPYLRRGGTFPFAGSPEVKPVT